MKDKNRDSLETRDTVDGSRRKLLGKAAYVAPALTLFAFARTANALSVQPPNPPVPANQPGRKRKNPKG